MDGKNDIFKVLDNKENEVKEAYYKVPLLMFEL